MLLPRVSHPTSPALAPAAVFLAATLAAPHLPWIPIPAAVTLVLLAVAWQRAAGWLLACFALGLLLAHVRWSVPERRLAELDLERPVAAVVRLSSHAVLADEQWLVSASTRYWSQGRILAPVRTEILLALPADVPRPAIGTVLRVEGLLRRTRDYLNPPAEPAGGFRLRVKSGRLMEVVAAPPWPLVVADGLRRRAETVFPAEAQAAPSDPAGLALARALLLGDTSRLAEPLRAGLRRAGLAHLLAVSGLNVTLVAWLLWLAAVALPRSARLLLTAAGVVGYLLLVGPQPPVLRAAVMALVVVAAFLAERPPQILNTLALAAMFLVLLEPAVVVDLGFQLSFIATLALVGLAEPLARRWRHLRKGLARPLAASLAAQIATFPLTTPIFAGLAPLGVFWNLLAVPWAGLFLAVAGGWLMTAVLVPPIAGWGAAILELLARPFMALADLDPGLHLWLPLWLPSWAAWLVAVALLAAAWWPRRALPWVLFALLAAGWLGARDDHALEVRMLDVGQGDAVLIRDGRRALLVDGGGWPRGDIGAAVLAPALAAAGLRRLDAVVMTHPDLDHCGGLVDLARWVPVEEVWMGPGWEGDECADNLLENRSLRRRQLAQGQTASLGRWRFEVLHPPAEERGGRNERSLVLLAEAAGRRLLLTGDVEAGAERRLVGCCAERLRADFLKVAHHGSKSSTTPLFLTAVRPRIALVSAGRHNPFGHPAPAVLERLRAERVWTLGTAEVGQVRLHILPSGAFGVEVARAVGR